MVSASTCTTPALHGQHFFVVCDYSLSKGLGLGQFIRSTTFNIGEYEWSIRYYPDGVSHRCKKYISVFLELMTQGAQVRAAFSFRILVGQLEYSEWTGGSPCLINQEESKRCTYGWEKLIERTALETSVELLMLNRIAIVCHIIIMKEPVVSRSDLIPQTVILSSGLSSDYGKLLESKEEADITFLVSGEAFPAHKMVLIARSPVFKAMLCGSMIENGASTITVKEIEPEVFKALLHFIYTDTFPLDNFDPSKATELTRQLLSAADRYGMEKLKVMCEGKLCMTIDVENIIIMLLLADQHQCNMLKQACLHFFATPNTMEKVMSTPEYDNLKSQCPRLLVEFLESASMIPKI